ncbi:hypothetical protein [Butyrivibrio sp. WCD3002]|uniref:hypothetical protein n=1 Tax=Butyrivibrio sp. WCD3002 TaxID=1280676 RepID=UPI0004790394|nr:hypothetical protein [Butyrivibrio sp. WCD3002]
MLAFDSVATGIELIGCTILNLNIENNIVGLLPDTEKSFGLNVFKPQIYEDGGYKAQARIEIVITIKQEGPRETNISLLLEGAFKSTSETTKEEFMQLVAINGVAALIGIARGKIESISGSIYNTGKIVIPFVNVVEYYKKVEKLLDEEST